MSFSFTISNDAVSVSPGGSVSITITQESSDPQAVFYGVSSIYAGGWDTMSLDQFGNITYQTSPAPASITGNGSLVLTLTASSGAQAQTLPIVVYGIQQPTGDPNSAINQAQNVTITVGA